MGNDFELGLCLLGMLSVIGVVAIRELVKEIRGLWH